MNFFKLIRQVLSLFFFLILTNVVAEIPPTDQNKKPPAGYYVVVAAYYSNGAGYAEKYAATFEEKGYNGQFAFFPEKQMFLVHLNHYTDFDEAISIMRNVRKEGVKDDAWVYVYRPEDIPVIAESSPVPDTSDSTKPKADTPLHVVKDKPNPEPEPEPEQDSVMQVVTDKSDSVLQVQEVEPEPEPEPEPEVDPYEGMQAIYFDLYQGVSSEELSGQIQIIDPEKARVVTLLNANEWHRIDNPSNTHQEIQLEADLFGYRKMTHVINLEDPLADSTDYFVEMKGDSILVDFEMVRYLMGDIFTMYNVYFITHSAIMRPESVYELDQLLEMLQENPNLEIILHGHTNGNAKGDMRYKSIPDTNFFSTTGAVEKTASAKVLSEERAMVVKRYLVHKGISESRIQAKGWGGKRMLYKKTDPQAIKNVRVEIEIVNE